MARRTALLLLPAALLLAGFTSAAQAETCTDPVCVQLKPPGDDDNIENRGVINVGLTGGQGNVTNNPEAESILNVAGTGGDGNTTTQNSGLLNLAAGLGEGNATNQGGGAIADTTVLQAALQLDGNATNQGDAGTDVIQLAASGNDNATNQGGEVIQVAVSGEGQATNQDGALLSIAVAPGDGTATSNGESGETAAGCLAGNCAGG